MSYTNDLTTLAGKIRLLIPDRKVGKMRFSDEDIAVFLELEGDVPKCAAALALETMASSKADCVSYIETNAIKLDGTKPAEILLKRAQKLRDQSVVAASVVENEDEDAWDFSSLVGC